MPEEKEIASHPAIIYEHADFIVTYKPAQCDFHDDQGKLGFFNQIKQVGKFTSLYPLHRLDKVTSGLLLMAKNKSAASEFGQLFEQHKIDKLYLALAKGKPKKKQGLISGGMKKSRGGTWMLTREKTNPAKTRFYSFALENGIRCYLLKPYSGKTHQLRVALKSLGCPILGDTLYKGCDADRTYLHAFCLAFRYKEQYYQFSQMPDSGQFFKLIETSPTLVKPLTAPFELKWN